MDIRRSAEYITICHEFYIGKKKARAPAARITPSLAMNAEPSSGVFASWRPVLAMFQTRRFRLIAYALAFAGVVVLAVLQMPLATPVTDLFHEGEYLGSAGPLAAAPAGFRLLTHGWLDIMPAWIAGLLMPADRLIVGTRLVNGLFG